MVSPNSEKGVQAPSLAAQESRADLTPGFFPPSKRPRLYLSAAEVMKLPKRDRDRVLAEAAILAEKEYRANPALTDFDAFADEEFHDAHD
ncbi:MAG: hypothetical protein JRJ79_14725 [Deltaproteobacteria bacterium]|nr:hypothetical protein [Deltaproteobacteria bacterium]MBW1795790.1 hypothetical protein [Deltaproteobacteria bacterium]